MTQHNSDFVSTLYAERANILSAQGLLSERLVALEQLLALYVAKTPSPATHSPETATTSTAARKDVPESDELAGPVQNQDGGSLAPQNDRAGGTVEVSAGVESVTVGRAEQPVACPRSNGSQAGTQAPPVDTQSEVADAAAAGASPAHHRPTAVSNPGGENVASSPAHAPEQPGMDNGSVRTPAEGGANSATIQTPAPQPGSEAAVDDADAAPAGEAPAPDASPAPRKVDGEEVERTQKRKKVAQLNARHPELTPEEAAARLLMPLITLRTFTAELGIEWSAARRAEPPAPTERRPTKLERIRLMHEAHPTWTARMIANELGEKETTVSTLLAGIRRAERERAVEEVVEKEPAR